MSDVVTMCSDGNAIIFCEGCGCGHKFYIREGESYENPAGKRLIWDWNYDMQHPTFHPSLLISPNEPEWRCHITVDGGWCNYLPDSFYEIRGQRRQLQPYFKNEQTNFMSYGNFLLDKWSKEISELPVPTWTEPACLAYCAEIASRSKFMVELGTYMGMSALVMLRANPELHLWTVDFFKAFEFNREVADHFLRDYIKTGRCEIITGDSIRAAQMLSHMREKLDAVWVDDGHATEDVKRDITWFLPLVKRGGIIFGHDWEGNNDVAQGVKATIPNDKITIPVPRLWSYTKP